MQGSHQMMNIFLTYNTLYYRLGAIKCSRTVSYSLVENRWQLEAFIHLDLCQELSSGMLMRTLWLSEIPWHSWGLCRLWSWLEGLMERLVGETPSDALKESEIEEHSIWRHWKSSWTFYNTLKAWGCKMSGCVHKLFYSPWACVY